MDALHGRDGWHAAGSGNGDDDSQCSARCGWTAALLQADLHVIDLTYNVRTLRDGCTTIVCLSRLYSLADQVRRRSEGMARTYCNVQRNLH